MSTYHPFSTCPLCGKTLEQPFEIMSLPRYQEIMMGLRSALKKWLERTRRKVTWLAKEAQVDRRRLDWFLNADYIVYGPHKGFYENLLEVEKRLPGYFDPLIVRLLKTLVRYHIERH